MGEEDDGTGEKEEEEEEEDDEEEEEDSLHEREEGKTVGGTSSSSFSFFGVGRRVHVSPSAVVSTGVAVVAVEVGEEEGCPWCSFSTPFASSSSSSQRSWLDGFRGVPPPARWPMDVRTSHSDGVGRAAAARGEGEGGVVSRRVF